MTTSSFFSNFQGLGSKYPRGPSKNNQGKPRNLKKYSSELFLKAELEELEEFRQKRNTGVHRLWDHIRTGAIPNMRSFFQREPLRKEWEENATFAVLKSITSGRKAMRKPSECELIWDYPSCESERLLDEDGGWRAWGPYLSERQWGTVREDYSEDGNW